MLLMHADAAILVGIALCCAVRVCEDREQSFFAKLVFVVISCAACFQAAWLVGLWIPGVNGYPWPRLSYDAAFLIWQAWRTVNMIAENKLHAAAVSRRIARG